MKKTWEEPKIMVQKFIPNEYVATCGDSGVVYIFECNAGEKNGRYAVKDSNGNVATISGKYMNGGGMFGGNYYHPCGEKHQANSNSGFLKGYHIDDKRTSKDENIEVIIWTDYNTDVHCTTRLNMNEWTTAKS